MSPVDWIAFAGFGGFMVVGAFRLRRFWHDDAPGLRDVPDVWPWGAIVWRGFLRALPSTTATGILCVLTFPIMAVAPEQAQGPFARPIAAVLPFLTVLVLGIMAIIGTAVFNRPKVLVPPHLRDQRGIAREVREPQES